MMKSKINSPTLESFIIVTVILIMGILFHMAYDWSHQNFMVGLISPINESKWEHWKIVFWPVILVYAMRTWIFKKGTFPAIPVVVYLIVFYLVTFGILEIVELLYGRIYFHVQFTLYILGALIGYIVSRKYMDVEYSMQGNQLAILILILLAALFIIITLNPPIKEYFIDPNIHQSESEMN